MSTPADDRMDALSEAIAAVLRRLDALEARLERLERAQGVVAPRVAPRPAPPPPPPAPLVPRAAEAVIPPPASPTPPLAVERPPELETRVGLTWINRAGVLTLFLGVAFFFKYAADNQWIGETGRVVLGVLAGFTILGAGEWFARRGHGAYAQGITATGLGTLYLSFYASFGFYRLVPQGVAFLLMALVTAMAGALAVRYRSVAISLLALVAGYLTPLLLSTGEDRPWVFFGYLLLLDAGAVLMARAQRWRILEYVSLAATVLLYQVWLADHFRAEKRTVATFYALAFYALYAVMELPVVFGVTQVAASLALLAILPPREALSLAWFVLLLAAGVLLAGRRGWGHGMLISFGAFWACCTVWQIAPPQPGQLAGVLALLTAAFLFVLGYEAWRLLVRQMQAGRHDLIVLAMNGAAYFGICYRLLERDYHAWLGLLAVALGGLHLALGMRMWNSLPPERRDARPVLLLAGVAVSFVTLAAPIQFSGYRITMAWALEAAALAWIGVRTDSRRLVWGALAVFLLTLVRLHTFDAWIYPKAASYPTLANARFLTFAATAVALWAAGHWMRASALAAAPYVAGHYVMLWALLQEVAGWITRAGFAGRPSIPTVADSSVLAVYGVVLILAGVLARLGMNRILGLVLLAAVVLKLYLYDVWLIEKIYRVAAFGFLGVLLLGTSFLYSRYRTAIDGWWRDENRHS